MCAGKKHMPDEKHSQLVECRTKGTRKRLQYTSIFYFALRILLRAFLSSKDLCKGLTIVERITVEAISTLSLFSGKRRGNPSRRFRICVYRRSVLVDDSRTVRMRGYHSIRPGPRGRDDRSTSARATRVSGDTPIRTTLNSRWDLSGRDRERRADAGIRSIRWFDRTIRTSSLNDSPALKAENHPNSPFLLPVNPLSII